MFAIDINEEFQYWNRKGSGDSNREWATTMFLESALLPHIYGAGCILLPESQAHLRCLHAAGALEWPLLNAEPLAVRILYRRDSSTITLIAHLHTVFVGEPWPVSRLKAQCVQSSDKTGLCLHPSLTSNLLRTPSLSIAGRSCSKCSVYDSKRNLRQDGFTSGRT